MTAPIVQRWLSRLRGGARSGTGPAAPAVADVVPPAEDRLDLDFKGDLSRAFAAESAVAWPVVERVLAAIDGVDLSPLARRSPALSGYDWDAYLRLSVARVVRVLRALGQHAPPAARVLDYGSYFGNFALSCRAAGYRVDAADSYAAYEGALSRCVALQQEAGIRVFEFATAGFDLQGAHPDPYDAILCMGVVEHVPHTPRPLLDSLTRLLKPGGVLIMDTPNLAYLYKRLALLEGQSVFCPLPLQYHTDLPFEGHHREYTIEEVEWMLREAGQQVLSLDSFNYSMFGQRTIFGEHVEYARQMESHPELREVIFVVSRRPA